MKKLRVLAVAPYAGMERELQKAALEFPEIALTVKTGDLEEGALLALASTGEPFDVLISRGGTARLISRTVTLPLIEIGVCAHDLLRAFQEGGAQPAETAVVAFAETARAAADLGALTGLCLQVRHLQKKEEILPALSALRQAGFRAFLCDSACFFAAESLGLNARLIPCGKESIRDALEKASFFFKLEQRQLEEGRFLRSLLQGSENKTAVFTESGSLLYSTLQKEEDGILPVLQQYAGEMGGQSSAKYLRQQGGRLYRIQAHTFLENGQEGVIFHVASSLLSAQGKAGIRYGGKSEVEERCRGGVYGQTGAPPAIKEEIDRANLSGLPVLIMGESGTGKEQVAHLLYLRGSFTKEPFVQADCSLLDDRALNFLLYHHNSPLCGEGMTLYLQNLNTLAAPRQQQLFAFLENSEVAARNRLIFSLSQLGDSGAVFRDRLPCFRIFLAPLRSCPAQIEPMAALYWDALREEGKKAPTAFAPKAASALLQFSWPQNYFQLKRVALRLAAAAAGPVVSAEEVREALSQEVATADAGSRAGERLSLDLSRPLRAIEGEVVRFVLSEQGGNQSRAASQLGISRTTLWRILKK